MTSSFCQELLLKPLVQIRGPELKTRKLKPADGFRHSLYQWSSPKIKVEINENRSSTKKIQLKENSTAEKNLKEDSKFDELGNFSKKRKKEKKKIEKKNTQIQRTLVPGHSLR